MKRMALYLTGAVAAPVIGLFRYLGQVTLLASQALGAILCFRIRGQLVLAQVVVIGIGSQLVVIITGAFTGAVFAVQAYDKFSELGLGSATGPVVSIAMCRELGPVLAALMVTGRMGASMAAEIGTMRVTEQIDALRAMGVSPLEYLVVPRILAILLSMPILVGEAILFGMLASEFLTVHLFGVPSVWYEAQLMAHTGIPDILTGLIKGTFFGGLIVLISCHQGLATSGGAVGVGRATTRAVVYSSLAILISNLFLSMFLNLFLPTVAIDL